MNVLIIAGARPNFMKIAPIVKELESRRLRQEMPSDFRYQIVHTGQHYDSIMSRVFFEQLDLPSPSIDLGVGSGSHAEQTGRIMVEFEHVCASMKPNCVIVVGDVNSTLACALVCAKLTTTLAHVEAGLRSFDRRMPEEINRVVTDSLSDLLFTTCREGNENLAREGIAEEKVHFVGNVMVDTLLQHKEKAMQSGILKALGLLENETKFPYAVLTLHRPSNVDNPGTFRTIVAALKRIGQFVPIVFPAHPRTQKAIERYGMQADFCFHHREEKLSLLDRKIKVIQPLGYLEFINLLAEAEFVMTDSGGIQEESTILRKPCLTLRESTERRVTITQGTNALVGTDPERIVSSAENVLFGKPSALHRPPLWDGHASHRIVNVLLDKLY